VGGEGAGVWGETDTAATMGGSITGGTGPSGGQWEPRGSSRCVPIPSGMALCQGIGYDTMRMPNLLDHETLAEVRQQAGSWVPLVYKNCHPGTQVFLCSLFAPVCMDRPVYPCRWLCEAVRDGCTPIMESFGFPWPDMLTCDRFPAGDVCIAMTAPNATEATKPTGNRLVSSPVATVAEHSSPPGGLRGFLVMYARTTSVCVCVCVCARARACERERERECVCVCVCARARACERVCVCVCVCARPCERECVCVRAYECALTRACV